MVVLTARGGAVNGEVNGEVADGRSCGGKEGER
jgi:hypothetical protein